MHIYKTKLIQLTLWLAFATTFVSGENKAVNNVITKETNAVTIGESNRDQATLKPLEYLKSEDANHTADNKPPEVFDFSFDGKTNCPLTIILNLKFAPNGAMRYLEKPISKKSDIKNGSQQLWKNQKTQSV
jgi:hypothetical protein